MILRRLAALLEKVEIGIFDPDYEPDDLNDYEYRQREAEKTE